MRSAEVQAVIDRMGGVSALARRLGVDHSTVSGWKDVPAKHVPAVAAATGLALRDIRPDLFHHDQRPGLAENQQAFATEARNLGLDPDAIAARALSDAIRAEKTRRWQEENRDAIAAHTRYVEEHGLPLAKYRMF
jgi:antitoxin CcdA